MAQASHMNTKPKQSIRWRISRSNDQLNSGLHPSQRNVQHHIESSVDRTDYSNTRICICQTARHHPNLPMKISNRISSSSSSTNNTQINQGQNISIDLRTSSNLQTKRTSILSPTTDSTSDNINKLTTFSFQRINSQLQRINSQRKRKSHLIENTAQLTRECVICLLDQPIYLFEERYSNQCEHFQRTICDTCVYNNIKTLVENIITNHICCPEPNCMAIFNFENIRYILTMGNNLELFERYDRQLAYQHLEQIQEFIWCAHNGCGSGQIHNMNTTYSNPMVTCIKCKKQTCAFHRIKWHVGMTCQEYDQLKIPSIDDNTQIWLRNNSKKCPLCQSYIEKISGCDHMTCTRCKHQFCWECYADYKKIQIYGRRQHMKSCTHYLLYTHSNNHFYRQRLINCTIL
ncbi:unnamed protein product [Rotaria sordida]|uniref:RBR-type E3 ubiquitin transferase n=1 Tax=Rotaria sordida TaxID=392033 RepID=A0A818TUB6_9BILA|nr:unnamed protein product [Rotaria sordida]